MLLAIISTGPHIFSAERPWHTIARVKMFNSIRGMCPAAAYTYMCGATVRFKLERGGRGVTPFSPAGQKVCVGSRVSAYLPMEGEVCLHQRGRVPFPLSPSLPPVARSPCPSAAATVLCNIARRVPDYFHVRRCPPCTLCFPRLIATSFCGSLSLSSSGQTRRRRRFPVTVESAQGARIPT